MDMLGDTNQNGCTLEVENPEYARRQHQTCIATIAREHSALLRSWRKDEDLRPGETDQWYKSDMQTPTSRSHRGWHRIRKAWIR